MSYRPDLHTPYWTKVVRPAVLLRDRFCPGFPLGYHRDESVHTSAVDHIEPGYVLTGDLLADMKHLRGLCGSCNSRRAVAEQGAWRFAR